MEQSGKAEDPQHQSPEFERETPLPSYMAGPYAPIDDEIDSTELEVAGALPAELDGRYFRNGPNPLPGEISPHWFVGDGMLHGVRLRNGRAQWYRNRWVRTLKFDRGSPLRDDRDVNRAYSTANTSIIRHGGRLFALVEGSFPIEVTPALDTVGACDFAGGLTTAMTAHPKQDPITGELHFFGCDMRPPFVTYHRLSAAGELVFSTPVDVPGPTMMHDFAITENHVIWLDLPVTLQFSGKGLPFQWSDDYGARIGVMSKNGGPVRWFDVEPCYVFHVGNAREDGSGRLILDAIRYDARAWNSTWPALAGETPHRLPAAVSSSTAGRSTPRPAGSPNSRSTIGRWSSRPSTPATSDARTGTSTRSAAKPSSSMTSIPANPLCTSSVTAGRLRFSR